MTRVRADSVIVERTVSPRAALLIVLTTACLGDPAQYGGASATGGAGASGSSTGGVGGDGGAGASTTTGGAGGGVGGEGLTAGETKWVVTLGKGADQSFEALAIANDDKIYAGGRWEGSFDIDVLGGACVAGSVAPAFIHALNAQGLTRWTRCFGSDARVDALDVNAGGTIAVAGTFSANIDIGDGVVTSTGETDVFIVVLGPNGDVVWGETFGSIEADDAQGVAHGPAGEVYVTGAFRGPMSVGNATLQPGQGDGLFRAKFFNDAAVWAFAIHTAGNDPVMKLAIRQGGAGPLVAAGSFAGSIDADALGPGSPVASADAEADLFDFELDPGGTIDGFRTFPAPGKQEVGAVGTSNTRIVISGTAEASIDFDGTGGPLPELVVDGGSDAFLLGMGFDQVLTDVLVVPGAGVQQGLAVALPPTATEPMLLAGLFAGQTSLAGVALDTPFGASDGFLALYPMGGSMSSSARRVGGEGPQRIHAAAFLDGDVVIVGSFADTLDLGATPVSAVAMDAFIARITP